MIQISTTAWYLPVKGALALHYAASHGVYDIQIDFDKPGNDHCLQEPSVIERYRLASKKSGVAISAIAINVLNRLGLSMNASQTTQAQTIFLAAANAAKLLNIKFIIVPCFYKNEIKSDEDFQQSVAFYQWGCDLLRDDCIQLASENSLNVEKNNLLFKSVNRTNFKLLFDTFNPSRYGHDVLELLKGLQSFLINYIHVKDGKNGVPGLVPIGSGEMPIIQVVTFLLKKNFDGYLVLENHYEKQPPETLGHDVAFIKQLIGSII